MNPNHVWPSLGTGDELASLLRDAANDTGHRTSGDATQVIGSYLGWVTEQVRMLQLRMAPDDLDRLLLTPRYWATQANPAPSLATLSAVREEMQYRATQMNQAAQSLTEAMQTWRPIDGSYTNLVVVDTSFWVEQERAFDSIDWHELLKTAEGPSAPAMADELRLVVPMVVIDELDGLAHKGNLRPKVVGATRWLYRCLSASGGWPAKIVDPTRERGVVTAQLVFEPRGHSRLRNNDDEIVETGIRLRDFLGHPARQVFFLTYDAGAAFRAGHAGLMPRLLTKPPRS